MMKIVIVRAIITQLCSHYLRDIVININITNKIIMLQWLYINRSHIPMPTTTQKKCKVKQTDITPKNNTDNKHNALLTSVTTNIKTQNSLSILLPGVPKSRRVSYGKSGAVWSPSRERGSAVIKVSEPCDLICHNRLDHSRRHNNIAVICSRVSITFFRFFSLVSITALSMGIREVNIF